MKQVINIFLKILAIICCVLFFMWAVFSLNYLVDMVTFVKLGWKLVASFIFILCCFILPKIFKVDGYRFIYKYRYWLIGILFICQVIFVLFTSALAKADTTAIFNNVQGLSDPDYFSAYTNNYLYGLYVKGIIYVFGVSYAVLAQELINIICLDIIILLIPFCLGKILSKKAAQKSFVLLVLTLGINPTIISTYTDYLSIITAGLIFYFCTKYLNSPLTIYELFLFGIVISVGSQIRATSAIFIIGLLVTLVLIFIRKPSVVKGVSKYTFLSVLIIAIGFSIPTLLVKYAKSSQVVHYTPGQTKSLLYYLDLGLTSTGGNHLELPLAEMPYGTSSERINEVVKKDIKVRVKKYNVSTALRKFKQGYEAGDFGWQAERVIEEQNLVRNNITSKFIDSNIGRYVRKITIPIDQTYLRYSVILQIFYIIVILEVILSLVNISVGTVKIDKTIMYMLVTIFGMFLYYSLFEFGRSRYLFSFWPLIVSLATISSLMVKENKRVKL